MKNPKYKSNKQNKGNIPICDDERKLYVPVKCGKCIECMKSKGREWQIRLKEEIKTDKNGKFITLTFNNESLEKYKKITGSEEPNEIATKAVRDFLERWRKKYGKSVKHWLITELGHQGTERLHLHGIIFTDKDIRERWQNGFVYQGTYVSEKTISYITKYVLKKDEIHKKFTGKIFTSSGIGRNYLNTSNVKQNKFKGQETEQRYRNENGTMVNMPQYYRNKIWTEEEKEKLWIQNIEKGERYIMGEKYDTKTERGMKEFENATMYARKINKKLGYGKPNNHEDRMQKRINRKINKMK